MRLGYSKGTHNLVHFYHYLAQVLGPGYSVVQSTQCDIFFYTFWTAADAQKCRPGTKLVFISGECWDTSQMRCSLLMDCKPVARAGPFLYYPFYVLSFFERAMHDGAQQLIKGPQYQASIRQKTRFCAFMYRYDVDFRVQLFDDLNRYKPVDALGKSRNRNAHVATDRGQATYMDNAVNKYRPYKFVICCENTRHPGYITEKIVNAMLANAIPIYYGAPDVAQHFNPKSFIDVGSFPTRQAALDYIRKVDQDDVLYRAMLNEPWFVGNKPTRYFEPEYVRAAFRHLPEATGGGPRSSVRRSLSRNGAPRAALQPVITRASLQPAVRTSPRPGPPSLRAFPALRASRSPVRKPLNLRLRSVRGLRSPRRWSRSRQSRISAARRRWKH